jgi:hypothetical protein
VGFSLSRRRWQHSVPSARGHYGREIKFAISGLLARFRRLVPSQKDGHYEEIVRGFGNGALRPPVTPMTDRELGQAIAEFLAQAPSAEAVSNLGRRIDPTSRL